LLRYATSVYVMSPPFFKDTMYSWIWTLRRTGVTICGYDSSEKSCVVFSIMMRYGQVNGFQRSDERNASVFTLEMETTLPS